MKMNTTIYKVILKIFLSFYFLEWLAIFLIAYVYAKYFFEKFNLHKLIFKRLFN